jgi:hypothetical protein
MVEWGFTRLQCEHCVYYRRDQYGTIMCAIHVDDFLNVGSSTAALSRFKDQLRTEWEIADLGEATFCVGIAINRDRAKRTISLSQTALIDRLVSQFGLQDAHPVTAPMEAGLRLARLSKDSLDADVVDRMARTPYRQLVGSLNYIACGTRPDISFALQQLSKHLDSYGPAHWEAAKRVVRYLKGTRNLQLVLGGAHVADLLGFTDASFATCPNTLRSVGGYCFSLGSGMVTWGARSQKTVSLSSCEAEYIAACHATQELVWLRALLDGIRLTQVSPTPLLCDNQGSIVLSEDPSFHARVKHVDIKYHYIRERVAKKELILRYVEGTKNLADAFTKLRSIFPSIWLNLRGTYELGIPKNMGKVCYNILPTPYLFRFLPYLSVSFRTMTYHVQPSYHFR